MAKRDRKAATAFLIEAVEEILPGGGNKAIYEKYLSQMSDDEFDALMQRYENGSDRPMLYAPNFKETRLNTERNLKLAAKHGHDFFERIWIGSSHEGDQPHLTNNKFMVIELPVRRQAQLLDKKISVPLHNRSVDQFTGQPSGDSRASMISLNELQILRAMGMEETLKELLKFRGGDIGGFSAMNKAIAKDGDASMKALMPYTTGVESTTLLKIYLTAMNLKNTL